MKVTCQIEEATLDGDAGPVAGVITTCNRCSHVTESFGTSDASKRRSLVLMREECPNNEENFYVDEDED